MFQAKQPIIIGGPACAGKTFLMRKMRQGDCPRLCKQLGMDTPSSWLYVVANKLAYIRQPIVERLVVRYNFHHEYSQEDGFNYLPDLISNSDSVVVLTLCVSPKILIQRITSRLVKLSVSLLYKPRAYRKTTHRLRTLWENRKTYKDGFSLLALYERWFDFFNECGVTSHWLLDSSEPNVTVAHPHETDKVGIFTGAQEVMDS